MELEKFVWKISLATKRPDTEELFRFFNSLIETSPEIFVDVADYKHVTEGPLVILVGIKADVGYESTSQGFSLIYNQKEGLEGSNSQRLHTALERLVNIFAELLKFPGLSQKPDPMTREMFLVLNDRACFPNNAGTFAGLQPEIAACLDSVLGAETYHLSQKGEPRERCTVRITPSHSPFDLSSVQKQISLSQ